MAKASFLLRPRWLVSHLFVVALVVVMVNLGFWQLDRLEQRRDRNDVIAEREAEPVVPVEQLLAPGDGPDAVDDTRFRPVSVTGTYDTDRTVVVRNRTQNGGPGVWALTPMELETGDAVGVVRGFVGLGRDGEPDVPAPPAGEVTVEGAVADPAGFDGTAPDDVEPLVREDGVLPAVVMAESSTPPEEGGPLETVAAPEPGEGPHLSYAVQWFIFSTIAAVGYPLVLRRVVQRRAGGDPGGLVREAPARRNGDGRGEHELDDVLGHG